MPQIEEILEFLGAQPDPAGGEGVQEAIDGPGTIDLAGPRQIVFCSASIAAAAERARSTGAGLALIDRALVGVLGSNALPSTVVVSTARPRLDFARVLGRFFASARPPAGVHATAVVGAGARISPDASIGPLCTIADDVDVGAGCVLHAGVHLYPGVQLGRGVVVHAGTVIGADGYGYERDEDGELVRFPHLGGVVVEDDVEIGANTTIDRGAIESTWIGPRARIDNLVHVAHNVRIGADAAIIASAMVAGSTKVGERSWIAPGACLREGIEVGAEAVVGIGAVVTRDVPAGETVFGNPARVRAR